MKKPSLLYLLVAVFIATHFLLAFTSARLKSPTSDEYTYISTGYIYITTWDFRLDRTHPPLIRLFIGLPLVAYQPWMPDLHLEQWDQPASYELGYRIGFDMLLFGENEWESLLLTARLPIMLLSCLLAWLLFLWARDLYGSTGALLTLAFYCFSPNILAHARLATLDLGVSFLFIAVLYSFYRYLLHPSYKRGILTGLLLGGALAAKLNAALLLPLLALALIAKFFLPAKPTASPPLPLFLKQAFLLFASAALVLFLIYGFPFKPFYFLDTLHNVLYKSTHTGGAGVPGMPHLNHAFYLFGEYSTQGWWYYYFAAMLVKTPLVVFLALLWSLAMRRWLGWADALLLSAILLIMATSAFNRVNIGLRHILPVYPLFFLYLGRIGMHAHRYAKLGWGALGMALLLTQTMIYPDYLAFFNLPWGGPSQGHVYLDDSNIDWGQDLARLRQIQENHPHEPLYLATNWIFDPDAFQVNAQRFPKESIPNPPSGIIAVGKHWAVRQRVQKRSPYYFDWWEKFHPIGHVGHSLLLYRFP